MDHFRCRSSCHKRCSCVGYSHACDDVRNGLLVWFQTEWEVRRLPRRLVRKYIDHFKHSPFYVILNTIAAISFAALFMWVYSQNSTNNRQTKNTAALVAQNSQLLRKIQNNRRDLIYKNCREQNQRHHNSLQALITLLKKSGVSKPRQAKAFKQTKIFIDALVPTRNCVKLANVVIKPKIKGEK